MAKAKHYSYRIDHDTGFAPHIQGGLCTLCGCKKETIENWAKSGSWVVGVGGNRTGKPNMLIYAMKVQEAPSYSEFRRKHPVQAAYLAHKVSADKPVLVSRHFYYFGDQAIHLQPGLSHIIHLTQGCKRLTDGEIALLNRLVLCRCPRGAHGKPNNPPDAPKSRIKPMDKSKGSKRCKSSC